MHSGHGDSVLLLVILLFATAGAAFAEPPLEGGVLPDFSLPIPENEPYREYLGLDNKPEFKIAEIDADVVIIQIFSMY
jgi:hypothetical protein